MESGADRDAAQSGLIEGEPRDSGYSDDAQQWVAVYIELVSFASRALARGRVTRAGKTGGAVETLETADVQRVETHMRRLTSRLNFWRRRLGELAGMQIDPQRRTLSYQGTTVGLTQREAQLLQFLSEHPGKAFTASQLVLQAWHSSELSEEELRSYIVRLRRSIANLQLPCAILNEPRRGYIFQFKG